MSGSTTVQHSVFSLRASAFNDFLYAPIGTEENGMILTVLSALARLGVDPWDEAARLSQLPKESAKKRLASIISGLPDGPWANVSAGEIATRLGALLPRAPAPIARLGMPQAKQLPLSAVLMVLFFVSASALVFFVAHEHAPRIENPSVSTSSTVASPQVPSP